MEPIPPNIRDDRLRADIRRLGNQLGDALTRQEGRELLDLVEEVRALTKAIRTDGDTAAGPELDALLGDLGLEQAINLVRAFSAYFHLANVAEQTHRIGDLAMADEGRTFAATADRVAGAGLSGDLVGSVLERLELRPVFHGPPDRGGAAHAADQTRQDRRSLAGAGRRARDNR